MGSWLRSSKGTGQEEQHRQPASPCSQGPPPGPTAPAALESCRKQPASARSPSRIGSSPATQGCLRGTSPSQIEGTHSPSRGAERSKQPPQEKGLWRVFPFTHHDLHFALGSLSKGG